VNHAEDGAEYASSRADFTTVAIARGGHCEIVAEEFVCAVDQMDFHEFHYNGVVGLLADALSSK
jgi:hypothetical protein